jgi:hypothetical protein
MKTFYNKLIATFENADNKAIFTDKNIPPVSYVDLYAGQDLYEENFELFSQPAVFVEWAIDYSGDVSIATVTLYACYEQLRDTSNKSLNKDLGLKFLDYIEIIDSIVSTIETETTGKLELVSEGFNKMDSIVDIYLLTYQCSYNGRKNPLQNYEEGEIENLDLKGNLVIELD